MTEEPPLGNLRNYVLERRCQFGDIVTFLSQVASALHYLHENHIVHGDLRATYVNVVSHDKVFILHIASSDYCLSLFLLISAVCKHGLMNAESAWKIAPLLPCFQRRSLKC